MTVKALGAALILAGCGGFGFSIAAGVRQQEILLRQLIHILNILQSELQYRLTPLPDLCTVASGECSGVLRDIFQQLQQALSCRDQADAAACMDTVLNRWDTLPGRLKKHLRHLGRSLGRFDLPGQLQGLQTVCHACTADLEMLQRNRDTRLRSYQTLSLCAGAALVVLFA